jgi:hypothetical protein
MTDKEIEILYNSIDNFDTFIKNVHQRQNLKLKNEIELKFNKNLTDSIDIYLPKRKVTIDILTFQRIINDLSIERMYKENQELSRKNKITEEQLRNEIFELGEKKFIIHKEYIDDMFFASQIASAHGAYLRKLQDMIKIFYNNNILMVDDKEITTKNELIKLLKSKGFEYIEKDLK